jgi:hypothetical protein
MTNWMLLRKFLKTLRKLGLNTSSKVKMERGLEVIHILLMEEITTRFCCCCCFFCFASFFFFFKRTQRSEIKVWYRKLEARRRSNSSEGKFMQTPMIWSQPLIICYLHILKKYAQDFSAFFFVCLPTYSWASTIQDLIYLCWFGFFSASLFMAVREALCPCW